MNINSCRIMVCATVACAILSCTHQHSESADSHSHPSESSVTSVHLDSADRVRLGIETAVINPDTFRSAIKVAGEIIPSSTDQYQITSPGAGVLRFATDLRPGLQISSGQTVAYVDASAVSGATVDKTSAAELAAAKREYLRLQSLRDEGLATVDELNAALSRYETARASHSTAAASGVVTAKTSGTLTELLVANGQFVSPGQPVATITRGGNLTLRVDVPERHASQLAAITGLNIRLAGDSAAHYVPSGAFAINRSGLFSNSRGYIPLTLTFTNPGMLSTGAFADVYLLSAPQPGILSVPRQALIEDQGSYFLYVALDDHMFERRKVEIGDYNGAQVRILSGLAPGENVAVKEVPMLRMAQSMSTPAEGHHHH
ncbi:MAG: efflux RND transporter periplasmic adaptor subunit [Paramuribaculum sp.]|nr:efflux RND transporter periplasmic adaptor subunit [Paramuribaculum sp.]